MAIMDQYSAPPIPNIAGIEVKKMLRLVNPHATGSKTAGNGGDQAGTDPIDMKINGSALNVEAVLTGPFSSCVGVPCPVAAGDHQGGGSSGRPNPSLGGAQKIQKPNIHEGPDLGVEVSEEVARSKIVGLMDFAVLEIHQPPFLVRLDAAKEKFTRLGPKTRGRRDT